eukprot:scaffold25467_cov112-Isochrysis_galbana.AAC.2
MLVGRVRAMRRDEAIRRSAGSAFFHWLVVAPPTSITTSEAPSGCSAATSARRGTSVCPGLSAAKESSSSRGAPSLLDDSTRMSVGAP